MSGRIPRALHLVVVGAMFVALRVGDASGHAEQGKTENRSYDVHRFGPGDGRGGNETVTVTQKITRLTFEHAGKTVWEYSTTAGFLPMMVSTRNDQTIVQAVAEQTRYDPSFLERVRLPAYLPAPSDAPWLGTSRWTPQGIADDRAPKPPPPGIRPPAPAGDGLD